MSESSETTKPRSGGRLSSILLGIREGCFSIDIYGYTPNLIVSEFKTFISLLTSFVILSAFSLAVIYTTYIWVVGNLNQTESDEVHEESIQILKSSSVQSFGDMPLPQFGVLLLLGNGTFVSWADFAGSFKITFQQSTVCSSDASNKAQDQLVQAPCTFQDTSSIANPHVTRCAAWEDSGPALAVLNNTASNPCKVVMDDGDTFSVPRIVGTFYNKEYSYITATVSINSSFLGNSTFVNNVAKGSMQVFIGFNYSRPSNFAQGIIEPRVGRVWSRRINLFPNVTIKAEVLIRPRKTTIHNYWWDVPSLERDLLDYLPWNVESYISIPGSVASGWTDVGKVFLRFDDRDERVDLFPPQDALAVVSGWGGFLSILLVVGTPAVIINRLIFQHKVKKLISEDKITFDEDVRTNRSQAVTKSYVQGGGKSIMTKTRNKSILGFLPGTEFHLPFLRRDSTLPTADIPSTGAAAPRASPPAREGQGKKVRLSFQNQDLSQSPPSSFRSELGGRSSEPTPDRPLNHEVKPSLKQYRASFPNIPESPVTFSTGMFRSGKVHAEPPTPSAVGQRAVPPDEPLFPSMRVSEEKAVQQQPAAHAAEPAPAAAAAGGVREAPHLASGAVRDDSALLPPAARSSYKEGEELLPPPDGALFAPTCPAADDDNDAMFGPGAAVVEVFTAEADVTNDTGIPSSAPAPDSPPQQTGPQPVGEAREQYQPRQLQWLPAGSADDLMELGWGVRPGPPSSSRPLSRSAQQHAGCSRCSSCSSTAALRRTALACCSDTSLWQPAGGPGSGAGAGGAAVCEHDEAQSGSHVAWSNELMSARIANTTFKFEEEAERPAGVVDHQVASMAVMYDGDCFADDDEDENYEDVVRHATSECNALFHLRQVVKLVQRDSPILTLWGDNLTVHQQEVTKTKQDRSVKRVLSKTSRAASRTEVAPFLPHATSEAGDRDLASAPQEQELSTRTSPQGTAESSKLAMLQWGAGAAAAAGRLPHQSLAASSPAAAQQYDPAAQQHVPAAQPQTPAQQYDPGFVASVSLWQEDTMRQAGDSRAPDMEELLQQELMQGPRSSQGGAVQTSDEIKPMDA